MFAEYQRRKRSQQYPFTLLFPIKMKLSNVNRADNTRGDIQTQRSNLTTPWLKEEKRPTSKHCTANL